MHRYDWVDLQYSGIVTIAPSRVHWRILEIVCWDEDRVGWWPADAPVAFPETDNPDKAHVIVEIDVKWDGCTHYDWSPSGSTHACDGGKQLTEMILRVRAQSRELLPATPEFPE